MQTASSSRLETSKTLSELTYIETQIKEAITQGLYYTSIKANQINGEMVLTLRGLGYSVEKQNVMDPRFAPYIISW